MDITLTDGGIETRIIYEFKRAIGDFEAYRLLADEDGRDILRRIYQSYVDVAARHGLPIQIGTPTWRASRRWVKNVQGVNAAAVDLLRSIRRQFLDVQISLGGVIGPASDGYATGEALSADAAFAYHQDQANILAEFNVDLLYAPTFPAFSELSGVASAMAATGCPYALAPMVHPRFRCVVSYKECLFTCERGFVTFVRTHEGPRNTSSSIIAPVYTETLF